MNLMYPISKKYASHWTMYDALRELWQNSIDSQDDGHEMYWHFLPEKEMLIIGNENAYLNPNDFLIGGSEKVNKIGQFGEGLKIAFLVLLREGCTVNFDNGGIKHAVVFEKSPDFNTDVLCIKELYLAKPKNDFRVTVKNISKKTFSKYTRMNLHLQNYRALKAKDGEVLTESHQKGKVYIGGLYICYNPDTEFGYNFRPGIIPIDRDRRKIKSFDLSWAAKGLIKEVHNELGTKNVYALAEKDAEDLRYLSTVSVESEEINDSLFLEFQKKHPGQIPAVNQNQANELLEQYEDIHPYIVNKVLYDILEKSRLYKSEMGKYKMRTYLNPTEIIMKFINKHDEMIPQAVKTAMYDEIVEASYNWQRKSPRR